MWALWIGVLGGFDLTIGRLHFTSHDPWRSAIGALAALALFVAAKGRASHVRAWIGAADRVDDRLIAAGLAVAVCATGIAFASTVAGGADAYGYVSEADGWISGSLKQPQDWARQAPWPSSRWSFSPLGYRPGDTDEDAWSIVPIYSPGLPLLMAGAKMVGGQEGMFWVVPILGGLLVLGTFGIGRRLGASRAGLIGAFLVATSPAVLFMLVAPMTDVAVAGAWIVAFYFLLAESLPSALLAGLAAGLAALIRPNVAFEVGVLGLWYLLRAWRASEWRREIGRACLFALGAAPGLAAIVAINTYLYGSPLLSGYGSFADQFVAGEHRAEREALSDPGSSTRIRLSPWPDCCRSSCRSGASGRRQRTAPPSSSSGCSCALLVVEFLAYLVFDVWWYLRFVIPCIPFVMLGLGALVMAAVRGRPPVVGAVLAMAVLALGVRDLRVAAAENTFDIWRDERRYVAAAQLTRRLTEPTSVIYTMQHSGSMRYYGGRLTVRYDLIDDDWLDRSVAWFVSRGVHPYLLLEDWEVDPFKRHFAGAERLAVLSTSPLFSYEGGAKLSLYDLTAAPGSSGGSLNAVETFADRLRSVPPAPAPTVTLGR